MTSMESLQNMIENVTIPSLESICGVIGDFDSIEGYLDSLNGNFVELYSSTDEIANLLGCESVNSIYVDAIHDNACTQMPHALLWTFVSLLIISFFGLLMITFRAAWLEVEEPNLKVIDELPIISIEKIQDLEDEQFSDSPERRIYANDRQDTSRLTDPYDSSRLTDTDNSRLTEQSREQLPPIHDPVTIYQTTSVADEGLQVIPSSPKDPPGYRVY